MRKGNKIGFWHWAALSAVVALIVHLCGGCTTIRHSHSSTLAVHDTFRTVQHDTAVLAMVTHDTVQVHDTTITIPGGTVADTFAGSDLKPGAYFHKTTGHVHSTVREDDAGRIIVTCEADSLRTVLASLTTIVRTKSDSIALLQHSAQSIIHDTQLTTKDLTVKTRLPWWVYVISGLFILAFIIEVVWRIKSNVT